MPLQCGMLLRYTIHWLQWMTRSQKICVCKTKYRFIGVFEVLILNFFFPFFILRMSDHYQLPQATALKLKVNLAWRWLWTNLRSNTQWTWRMASLMRVLVAAQLGPRHPVVRGRVVLPGLALPPHRLQLGLVHHQQADEHEEAAEHHGGGHTLGRVVLRVELLLLRRPGRWGWGWGGIVLGRGEDAGRVGRGEVGRQKDTWGGVSWRWEVGICNITSVRNRTV